MQWVGCNFPFPDSKLLDHKNQYNLKVFSTTSAEPLQSTKISSIALFKCQDLCLNILYFQVAAVSDWLKTNKTFHIMRDHPSHNGKYHML